LWLQGFLFHFGGFLLPLQLAFFRAASFALFALALSLLPLSLFGRIVFLLLLFQRAVEAKLLPELCRAHRYSGAQVYAGAPRCATRRRRCSSRLAARSSRARRFYPAWAGTSCSGGFRTAGCAARRRPRAGRWLPSR